MWFLRRRRYAPARSINIIRVPIVEGEPFLAEAIHDGLRLEAIAADIAGEACHHQEAVTISRMSN